jgi:hypothetical protein
MVAGDGFGCSGKEYRCPPVAALRTGAGVVSYSTSRTRLLVNMKLVPLMASSRASRARSASLPASSASI